MDNEDTEFYRSLRSRSQEKRSSNRKQSAKYLQDRDIQFTEHNDGAHLIVEGQSTYIDFWPGTGKWNSRCGRKGFGVSNLVAFILEASDKGEENND